MITVTIDNKKVSVPEGTTVLEAARTAGIYIPALCSHPDLPPFGKVELSDHVFQDTERIEHDAGKTMESIKGCGVCIVMQKGADMPVPSCKTLAVDGMEIQTDTDQLRQKRRQNLSKILANHPHSCLTCSQREGCIPLTDVCPGNVPVEERCCALLGNCELQRLVDYVGIMPETPKYTFAALPKITNDPFFIRDYNLCIACGRCVRVCRSVKGVGALGAVIRDGRLVVGTVDGPLLDDAECRFCGACVEVCPTGALQDRIKPRLHGEPDMVPCKEGCPGQVDIPLYVRLIDDGKYAEVGEVIASKLPLPSVLGKVCFHPCEANCRRGKLSASLSNKEEPVAIRHLKDYAMSRYTSVAIKITAPPMGGKAAVIGGGPAGLTAAHFLAQKGHEVTIFEKETELGGMLRYGIPRYRLPGDILQKDLDFVLNSGITVEAGVTFGKDLTLKMLRERGMDAVFIAVGMSKGKKLPVTGADSSNVLDGIDFLHDVADNSFSPDSFASKEVVVIGGGNVATDAARTAVRLKADKVTIVCLEQRGEMPAYAWEITEAEEEGVQIRNGWGIERIDAPNGAAGLNIILKKCTSVFDVDGRFDPEYDVSVKDSIRCGNAILCIGQEADTGFLDGAEGLSLAGLGTLEVNSETGLTSVPGVYAGGDISSGPASVIDAVAAGRKAARAIDKILGGDGVIDPEKYSFEIDLNMYTGREEGFSRLAREPAPSAGLDARKSGFTPIEETYTEEAARREAHRCLRCDLRLHLGQNPHPPVKCIAFNAESIAAVPDEAGVIQLLNDEKEVLVIKGGGSVRSALQELLNDGQNAAWFMFELDPMYTKRESELIQQYLQKHGRLPDSGDGLDDLF